MGSLFLLVLFYFLWVSRLFRKFLIVTFKFIFSDKFLYIHIISLSNFNSCNIILLNELYGLDSHYLRNLSSILIKRHFNIQYRFSTDLSLSKYYHLISTTNNHKDMKSDNENTCHRKYHIISSLAFYDAKKALK